MAMTEDERVQLAMADDDFVHAAVLHAICDKNFVKDFLIVDLRWQLDDIEAFTYLSDTLQRDPEVILAAMAKDLTVMRRCTETALSATLKILSREFPKGSKDEKRRQTLEEIIYESLFLEGGSELLVQFMEDVPVAVRRDRDFLLWFLTSIQYTGIHDPNGGIALDCYLEWVGEELRADKGFMLKLMHSQCGHEFLIFASEELRDDEEVVRAALEHNDPGSGNAYGDALQHASARLRNDEAIVMLACKDVYHEEHPFRHASDELRSSRTFVYALARDCAEKDRLYSNNSGHALGFFEFVVCPDELKQKREFLLKLLGINGLLLSALPSEFCNDPDMAAAAVTSNGLALEYTSAELKCSSALVSVAVSQNGCALQFASDKVKADRDIVLKAVESPCTTYLKKKEKYRDEYRLKYTKWLMSKWISIESGQFTDPSASNPSRSSIGIGHAPHGSANNDEAHILSVVADSLKGDKGVVMVAVAADGLSLKFASDELRDDPEVCLAAMASDIGCCMEHVSERLQQGGQLSYIRQQLQDNIGMLAFRPPELSTELIDHIAAYVDAPSGERLMNLHRVRDRLAEAIGAAKGPPRKRLRVA